MERIKEDLLIACAWFFCGSLAVYLGVSPYLGFFVLAFGSVVLKHWDSIQPLVLKYWSQWTGQEFEVEGEELQVDVPTAPQEEPKLTVVPATSEALEAPAASEPQGVQPEVMASPQDVFGHADSSDLLLFESLKWQTLIRNAKDGGANSILAADVLRKTSVTLGSGEKRLRELLDINQLVETTTTELQSISHDIGNVSAMTQMVSFNAAIEAQKAGEHGKTFEIVAGEISKLARSVKDLTVDVDNKLERISQSVRLSHQACRDIATLLMNVSLELNQFKKIILRVENLSTSQEDQLAEFKDSIQAS